MSRLADVKRLQNEMGFIETLGGLVQTYEEIYVARMQKIRKSVVGTRDFTEGLRLIFAELRQHERLKTRTELDKSTPRQQINKHTGEGMLVVLLTTSQRWAGDINRQVFEQFWEYKKKHPKAKVMIIGKIGKEFY